MRKLIKLLCVLSVFVISSCTTPDQKTAGKYPETKKIDTVDVYFGAQVPDPYRWLENDTAKSTADWVTAQNEVT